MSPPLPHYRNGDTRQAIKAIIRLVHLRGLTQQSLATKAGINNATLTHLSHGMRPTPATLSAVLHAWEDANDGLAVLCAHLRDEIARADVADALLTVEPRGQLPPANEIPLAQALAELRRYAQEQPDVYSLLIDLVTLVRSASRRRTDKEGRDGK